jgi:O-antigen ligase
MIFQEPGIGRYFFAFNSAHNATGSVYAVICIFLLVFFLKGKNLKTKIFYLIILLINLLALFLTKSRSSYIGFIIAAIIVIWLHFRSIKRFLLTIGIFIAGTIPILYFTGNFKRIIAILPSESFTTVVRLFIWDKAWFLFSQSPLFGIGFGRFNDIFSIDRGVFDTGGLKGVTGVLAVYLKEIFYFDAAHAHNSYLQFLVETGIIGLALLMLFWILSIIKILKAYNNTKEIFTSKLLLSAMGSIFILFILALFENYFSATTVMISVSMIVPISLGVYWQSNNKIISTKD